MKFPVNPVETFQEIDENLYVDLFWPYLEPEKRPENLTHRGHFSHTTECSYNAPLNQVSWSNIKNYLRKWTKAPKIPIFKPIFVS